MSSESVVARPPEKHVTVYIVEDHADTRAGLKDALARDGFDVFATADGGEMLDQLRRSTRPSAIVLDLYLPGLSGFDLYRLIQADPHLRTIPLIVVTAAPPAERIGLDVSATIDKPVDLVEFILTVQRAVARGRAWRSA